MYFEASKVVDDTKKKKSSLKNLVYSSSVKNKKALYALSCEALKCEKPLLEIAESSGLLKDKRLRNNESLVAVLMYEHLLGKGVSGKYKAILQKYRSSIHSRCEKLKVEHRVTDIKQLFQKLAPSSTTDKSVPKYVRVNTLLTTEEDAIKHLQKKFQLKHHNRESELMETDEEDWFVKDEHIPGLLMFHPAADFHTDPLYKGGQLIIQDKASCFPAYILDPPPGSCVIDCCAAPGNKTSHLAAIMKNKGKIFAFDRDAKRLATLKKLVTKAGASCIHAECKDFLTVNPHNQNYKSVEYILVDPSCSGSGMVNRQRQNTDELDSCTPERLQQLAKFQISILKHALSFPKVKKVVYSTCSIHNEENELVVEEVLGQVCEEFEVDNLMPMWKFRGKSIYKHSECCLRMSVEESKTNGFFVACFIRRGAELRANVRSDFIANDIANDVANDDVANEVAYDIANDFANGNPNDRANDFANGNPNDRANDFANGNPNDRANCSKNDFTKCIRKDKTNCSKETMTINSMSGRDNGSKRIKPNDMANSSSKTDVTNSSDICLTNGSIDVQMKPVQDVSKGVMQNSSFAMGKKNGAKCMEALKRKTMARCKNKSSLKATTSWSVDS